MSSEPAKKGRVYSEEEIDRMLVDKSGISFFSIFGLLTGLVKRRLYSAFKAATEKREAADVADLKKTYISRSFDELK